MASRRPFPAAAVLAAAALAALPSPASPSGTPLAGVLKLDAHSFNKTIRAFPWAAVKFDVGYPTGPAHQAWADLALDLLDLPEVGVMEVRVKEFGNRDNQDLATRFGITKDTLPQVNSCPLG